MRFGTIGAVRLLWWPSVAGGNWEWPAREIFSLSESTELPHVCQRRHSQGDTAARAARGPCTLCCTQADQAGRETAYAIGRGRRDLAERLRLQGCRFH